MHLLRLLSLMVCLLTARTVLADPVVINFGDGNPPFMYADQTRPAGIYAELIAATFRHMDTPVSLQTRPWGRCLQELSLGLAGLGGLYKTAEREKSYDYSEPVFSERLAVYFRRSHPVGFSRLEDLHGLRVGILRDWSYGDRFDDARQKGIIVAEETTSDELNFRKLERGHIDVLIAVREAGDALLPKHPGIEASPHLLITNPTYLAFAKSAHRTELLRRFNETLREMKASGEFARIISKASRQD